MCDYVLKYLDESPIIQFSLNLSTFHYTRVLLLAHTYLLFILNILHMNMLFYYKILAPVVFSHNPEEIRFHDNLMIGTVHLTCTSYARM